MWPIRRIWTARMRFVDLFAGLGGFHLAATELGGRCVFACEIEPKLRSAYEANFGMRPAGDIRDVDAREIPPHDLLCAGFPCQPFSKAGDQMGWRDATRGTVFYNIAEILRVRRPELVVLENVAHFVRHDRGNTYRRVQEALTSLGYDVQVGQLSPHQFGVPQIRERMYMVGRSNGLNGFKWPQPETEASELSIRDVLDTRPPDAIPLKKQTVLCLNVWQEFLRRFPGYEQLPSFPIWSMEFGATYPYEIDSLYDLDLPSLRKERGVFGTPLDLWYRRDIMPRVPSYARRNVGAFPRWKQTFIRQNRELYRRHKKWIDPWLPKIQTFPSSLQKLEWNCKGEPRDIWRYVIQFRASGVRVKRTTTSPSLVAMTTTQVPIIAWEKRYMTVQECARLQSMGQLRHFPLGFAAVSALGNAVNVKVARLVLQSLLRA